MIAMTEFLEKPYNKYILEPDNPRMEAAINYVKGFEITITHWEGKFKLSQDKNKKDMENARKELIRFNQESIADFLKTIF
jgi:transcriptional regulator